MTRKRFSVLLAVSAVGITTPLFGESGNKKLVSVTSTQQAPFQAGGTIQVNHSYGELWVEGWDRPEVEITVTKTRDELYAAKDKAEASKCLENVKVTLDRKSDSELDISTAVSHFRRWTHPFGPMGGVTMEYRIRVPRDSKLVIHHEDGEVMVSNMSSDIEATGRRGDIVLLLPETEKYSIDAKSKLGTLTCDFDGDYRHGLMSSRYAQTAPAGHRVVVRMGVGGIEIKGSPAEAQSNRAPTAGAQLSRGSGKARVVTRYERRNARPWEVAA